MSFKCSIFGHKYGETEGERDREEEGSEVIITIRETETCLRCGDQRVVSENKEVTTLETAADIVADDLADEPADEPETESQQKAQNATAEKTHEAEPTQQAEATIPDAESEQPATTTGSSKAPEEVVPDSDEDDAVILDDEAEATDDRDPGEWPEEPEEDESEWQPETSPETETLDSEGDSDAGSSAVTVPDGTFYCPECEFTTPVEESSLREGDFCPECHRGSLEIHSE